MKTVKLSNKTQDSIASGVIQTCKESKFPYFDITISKDVIDSGKYNFTDSDRKEIIEILKKLGFTEEDKEIKKIRSYLHK